MILFGINWGGQKASDPAKHRTDDITPIKKMAKFANYFKMKDSNPKITTDIQKLEMLSDAIRGAAVAEYEKIAKSYEGTASYVTGPKNSAMYCALNEVFKISEMSQSEKEAMKGAYAYYQQKFQPEGYSVEKENGSRAMFIA